MRGGLRRRVRALRVERRRLVVNDAGARRRAEHLAGRGLVEARAGAVLAHRVEEADDDVGVRLPRRARVGERGADARLAGEVVELLRPQVADERAERAGVAQVAADGAQVRVVVEQLLRALDLPDRRVHGPAVREQAADEVEAVLPGRARDEGRARLDRAAHRTKSRAAARYA